jgi:recombination protein RecT
VTEASATQQTEPTKALATIAPREVVKADLDSQIETFMEVMEGDEKSARRIAKMAYAAITKNPELLNCVQWPRGRASLIQAVVDAAEVNLPPSGNLNRASIAPFREHSGDPYPLAKLMIGYEGLADLMRDGPIEDVWAEVVYEGDLFEVEKGLTPTLKHVPAFLTEDVTKVTYLYAVAFFKSGKTHFEVMSREQVEAVRAMSRSKNGPAWTGSWPQMARKTVLRRLSKYVPLSDRAAKGIQRDDEREFGPEHVEVRKEAPVRATSLKEQIRGSQKPQDAPEPEVAPEPTPDPSATQQTPPAVQQPETTEGEADEVCGEKSPYEDSDYCRSKPHAKGFHKGSTGATWGSIPPKGSK